MKTFETKELAKRAAIGSDRILKTNEGWIVVDFWDRRYNEAETV